MLKYRKFDIKIELLENRNYILRTFEHVGVKAPGTPNKMPFLPANKSAMLTLLPGLSSYKVTLGNLVPS